MKQLFNLARQFSRIFANKIKIISVDSRKLAGSFGFLQSRTKVKESRLTIAVAEYFISGRGNFAAPDKPAGALAHH